MDTHLTVCSPSLAKQLSNWCIRIKNQKKLDKARIKQLLAVKEPELLSNDLEDGIRKRVKVKAKKSVTGECWGSQSRA